MNNDKNRENLFLQFVQKLEKKNFFYNSFRNGKTMKVNRFILVTQLINNLQLQLFSPINRYWSA